MLKAPLDSAARRKANPGAILNVSLVYSGCFSWQKLDGHLENWHDRKHRKGYNHSSVKTTKSFLTWSLFFFVLIQKKKEGGEQRKRSPGFCIHWTMCSSVTLETVQEGMAAGLFCSQKQIIHEKLADYFSVCPPACLVPFPPFQIVKFLSSLNCHCVEVISVLFFSPLFPMFPSI